MRESVERPPVARCDVGSVPSGGALNVWPWSSETSVLNNLFDFVILLGGPRFI
jgi:hypothetical protein